MLNCVLIAVTEHPCFTDSLQVYAVWYLMLFKEEDQIQYAGEKLSKYLSNTYKLAKLTNAVEGRVAVLVVVPVVEVAARLARPVTSRVGRRIWLCV